METRIPAREVTATKVLVIENATEGVSSPSGCSGASPPGPDVGPFESGAGGEEVVAGEGVGDGAAAELGDNDCVGAGPGACCAMHEVAKSPNITNTLIATKESMSF
ncbi:hypothetical protein RYX36_025103 [Vicia faba]